MRYFPDEHIFCFYSEMLKEKLYVFSALFSNNSSKNYFFDLQLYKINVLIRLFFLLLQVSVTIP